MIGMSQIFLCNLKLHHFIGLRHTAIQWAIRLAWFKIYRTVLNLNNYIIAELSVKRLKHLLRLLVTVGI